jgi:eukaryotic-like serine/threonine-protein kinase
MGASSFGRYEIVEKLGEGAMGIVYRARDPVLARIVALKMLAEELSEDDDVRARFTREAEVIGQLGHPNIVSVFDMGESEGRLFMAMEMLEGEDLRRLLERHAPLSLAARGRIMVEICTGLGFAHSKGVVHRDMKPANIFVPKDGPIRLLDFGLARLTSRVSTTRKGVILGTPDYMSPEQAGGHSVGVLSEIFSTGAVFYELLTGTKPFRGKTLPAVLYQIISGEPEAILSLSPEVPARLAMLVHRMLSKKPEHRPASLEEVRGGLLVLPALRDLRHGRT